MMTNLFRAFLLFVVVFATGCNPVRDDNPKPDSVVDENEYVNRCDFQNVTLTFSTNGSLSYTKVANPLREDINVSSHCGKVVSAGGKWELIYSKPLSRKFDFTKNKPIFKMKVLAPKVGGKVYFKIEPATLGGSNPPALEVTNVVTAKSGEWEELVFDFTDQTPGSNLYQKILLIFDAGETGSGEEWYFDDILCPSDDLTSICLFQRYKSNPIFNPTGQPLWCQYHMANAGIISPSTSTDGNWWLYLRGSGISSIDGQYHDQIGLFTQKASDFEPFGPWTAYPANPVINHGNEGEFDERNILDTAPVVGKDGVVYVYFNGNNYSGGHGLCGAYSTDGGYTFTKFANNPVIANFGCSDAVYCDEKYYIYYGGGSPCRLYVTVTDDPTTVEGGEIYETIPVGGGPSNFDSKAVNGSMVFRLEGVDKWFASYQGSSNHYDFPDRFHIAMSDDLIHWTKVKNDQPLFTRGSRGEWDQGGIWFCEIFEHEDNLYLYYEGWGKVGYVEDRDIPYFSGRSCVGAATASKADFLKWCGLSE